MDKPKRKRGSFLIGGALGALLQYFFDPERGRSRRAQTKDRVMGLLRRGAGARSGSGAGWGPRRTG